MILINRYFTVMGADNALMQEALEIDGSDFEDFLQYIYAKKSKCELIVSNDSGFCKGDMELLTSKDFLAKLL